jgi:hypothetical protein
MLSLHFSYLKKQKVDILPLITSQAGIRGGGMKEQWRG